MNLKYFKNFNESSKEMCKIIPEIEFDKHTDISDRDCGLIMSDKSIKICKNQISKIEEFLGSDFKDNDFHYKGFTNLLLHKSNIYEYCRNGLFIRIIELEDEWYFILINNNDIRNIHIECDQIEGLSQFGDIAIDEMEDQYGIRRYLKEINESNSTDIIREITSQEVDDFESDHKRILIDDSDESRLLSICNEIYENSEGNDLFASNNSKGDEYVGIIEKEIDGDILEELIIFKKYEDNWWIVAHDIQDYSSNNITKYWKCDDVIGLNELKKLIL